MKFALGKQRGLNASVVADGHLIYASRIWCIDNTVMGRVVCIDTGAGDITQTHEVWRVDGCQAGYSSPALHDGRLCVVDHSANLYALILRQETNIGFIISVLLKVLPSGQMVKFMLPK